jgi:hypothetical protein
VKFQKQFELAETMVVKATLLILLLVGAIKLVAPEVEEVVRLLLH